MKKRSIKVSIGIPVYKAEKYIERCLNSILNQNFESYEVILVDDCGGDNSIKIAQEIIQASNRGDKIRILHHERNLGVANARNTIIHEARGKYLYLMDADDAITKETISILYNKAILLHAEYVLGSYLKIFEESHTNKEVKYPDMILNGEDKLVLYECQNDEWNIQPAIWNILYDMDFLRSTGLRFEQHGSLDDLIFQFKLQPLVKSAIITSNITYHYYIHANSLSNFHVRTSYSHLEAVHSIEAAECLKESCRQYNHKPYFDCRCTKVMRHCFFHSYGIIKHRNMMDKPISNKEIRKLMKHPYTLLQILTFKRYLLDNLFYYLLGIMPAFLMIATIKAIARIRGYK